MANGPERTLISNNAKKAQANREEAGTDMVSGLTFSRAKRDSRYGIHFIFNHFKYF
jgi:hypothetical protein